MDVFILINAITWARCAIPDKFSGCFIMKR